MERARVNKPMCTIQVPAEWIPDHEEMFINKIGPTIIIMPKSKVREEMQKALNGFTEDFFSDRRPVQIKKNDDLQIGDWPGR